MCVFTNYIVSQSALGIQAARYPTFDRIIYDGVIVRLTVWQVVTLYIIKMDAGWASGGADLAAPHMVVPTIGCEPSYDRPLRTTGDVMVGLWRVVVSLCSDNKGHSPFKEANDMLAAGLVVLWEEHRFRG